MDRTDTVSVDTPKRGENFLTLYPQVDADGHAAAMVPVRWCLSPQFVELVKEHGYTDLRLVIAVRAPRARTGWDGSSYTTYDQTVSYNVPLDQEMAYVQFSRPGHNEIRAIVVRGEDSTYVSDTSDQFTADGDYCGFRGIEGSMATVDVDVPKEFFAKPLSDREARFLRNFYEGKPFDQCHIRRRRIMAYGLIVPFLLSVVWAARVVSVVLSIAFGRRNVPWRGLLPFNTNDFPWGQDRSVYVADRHGRTDYRRIPLWLLNPPVFIGAPAIVFGISSIREHHGHSKTVSPLLGWGWWQTVGIIDGALLAVVIVLTLAVAAILCIANRITAREAAQAKRRTRAKRAAERRQAETARYYDELSQMTCSYDAATATLDALPQRKRTFRLRFNKLKAEVCKPFAH